jgi:hypothetical protein
MKNLLFEELMIMSKTEKKAKKVSFSPSNNLVLGENDVGKSTLIKSLYHALGADTPQIDNSRWKKANPIYRVKISFDGKSFYIVRDEKYFGFFDAQKKLIGRFQGVSNENGFGKKINQMLGFNIKLETSDGKARTLSPAYYFLPFYVDQDEGWGSSWSSFRGLQGIKDYRKNMIDYHLGIKPQKYYDAVSKLFDLDSEDKALSSQVLALNNVLGKYKSRKSLQRLDIDPADFKAEIEELVEKFNEVYGNQQFQLGLVKDARNKRLAIEREIIILEKSFREMEADYQYLETPSTPDVVGCPTCGTEFHNTVAERFGILDDVDYCRQLIDQKKKELLVINAEVKELDSGYQEITKELESVEALLNRKKENITLLELIQSEGYKDIIQSVGFDISELQDRQNDIAAVKEHLKEDTKIDKELKSQIFAFYQSKMKESLNKLNVHVLTEDDYKSPEKVIKNNALGSDLPRSLLAQYVSFLHTMKKYNSFVVCPLVIDSPIQQEQDSVNAEAIFSFIFSGLLDKQQLILGTLKDYFKKSSVKEDFNIIELNTKYGLLNGDEYDDVYADLSPMHEAALSVEG